MCGRYATTKSEADLGRLFDAVPVAEAPAASWNVAPTDPVPLIRMSERHEGHVVDTARWGLVPPWAKDPRAGSRMINARAETVAESPAFAPSFQRRRCLVPADGWYEWVRTGKQRQAYYMTPRDSSVLAFAGIWTMWRGTRGTKTNPIEGEHSLFGFLTCEANAVVAPIHPKARPVILMTLEECEAWMTAPAEEALRLQRPLPDDALRIVATGERQDRRPEYGQAGSPGSPRPKTVGEPATRG